ncbi:GAF domain-containing sensor histidine kinase [Oscillatoria sp. FACHB-1407]|uniref:GAF domain-containing sensor histidine kinase n=1 Tax=Oscillatoria sp. FACHB-1407 TaxID=2692847 RepID=UPI001F554098|nr:GAF domain-containing sensor histidine kinase [Oscillatoria sp. FACHB-1407]
MPNLEREQQRLRILKELGLLENGSVPVFEEATQTAAHILNASICILGVIDHDRQIFKSAVGLSRIGLMNDLASSRQLARPEAFCTHVVESRQVLAIDDATLYPAFAASLLVQRYGIRAYLGVPLVTSSGHCIGTLAILDLAPRQFTAKEIELLELVARWSMSEFERNRFLQNPPPQPEQPEPLPSSSKPSTSPNLSGLALVKLDLITQMTQELRTPLTSILGMASVLNREIYGPLTDKQKEYMDIIHNSGQYLLTLVNEVLEVGALATDQQPLNLTAVDIEMLCQQAFSTLGQSAQRREQQIRLTVEPGQRVWLLDKDKVRQMLYHLVFNVIQASSADSIIRIHVAHKRDQLHIAVWTSHPWLGDGLPQAELRSNQLLHSSLREWSGISSDRQFVSAVELDRIDEVNLHHSSSEHLEDAEPKPDISRQSLGLMFSRCLAQTHGGDITIQGSAETGYRYVIQLPRLTGTPNKEEAS